MLKAIDNSRRLTVRSLLMNYVCQSICCPCACNAACRPTLMTGHRSFRT